MGFVDADGAIPSHEVENFIQYILNNPTPIYGYFFSFEF